MPLSLTVQLNEAVILHLPDGDIRLVLTEVEADISSNPRAKARLLCESSHEIEIVREVLEEDEPGRPQT
jgi:hypothetical protein